MLYGNHPNLRQGQELWDWLHTTDAPESQREQEKLVMQEIAADLAWAVPVAEPSEALRARLLSEVTKGTEPFISPALLSVRTNEGKWVESAPGVAVKTLFNDQENGLVTSLYRLAPGTRISPHRHLGNEQCYVLQGDFHIGEQVYGAGDYQCATAGSIHETISTIGGTLLLIVAPAEYEALA